LILPRTLVAVVLLCSLSGIAHRTFAASDDEAARKLSPALRATRDAGGVLRGLDDTGHAVITVKTSALDKLRYSASVLSVVPSPPPTWNAVEKLKLSYRKGSPPTEAELDQLGLRLIEDYSKGSFLIVALNGKPVDAELIEKFTHSEKVQYVSPSLRLPATRPLDNHPTVQPLIAPMATPNDPRARELWAIEDIHAQTAWAKGHDSNVTVAVIDSGVDYSHEDLKDNMWTDANGKHGYDFVNDNDDPMDQFGHGTHCAGIIGAKGNNGKGVVGVNWNVRIMAVRWLDDSGRGELPNAIKAIDFAVEHGAKVLNNSWYYFEYDPDLEAAIKRAKAADVLFVAAAGNFADDPDNNGGDNDQETTTGRIPSSLPEENIIAVAALDRNDNKATFSEFGKKTVHLAAPGVDILSTVPHDRYELNSGTSMAAPYVSGAAALIMGITGHTSAQEIKQLLLQHVRKIPSLNGKCVTEGTLDLSFLALNQASNSPKPHGAP
jgi:thermitase